MTTSSNTFLEQRMLWQTHSAGLPTHRVSRHVPATRPRPLAPSGMREEGMWSDAEREDGMWSDAERAMDILKWSRRPLLSFFLSFFFLPHATTCLSPFSNRSILPQPVFSCPVSAATGCCPCPCPVSAAATPFLSCPILSSAAAARRSCPVRSCPRPPPRADLVLVPLPKALSARPLQRESSQRSIRSTSMSSKCGYQPQPSG